MVTFWADELLKLGYVRVPVETERERRTSWTLLLLRDGERNEVKHFLTKYNNFLNFVLFGFLNK